VGWWSTCELPTPTAPRRFLMVRASAGGQSVELIAKHSILVPKICKAWQGTRGLYMLPVIMDWFIACFSQSGGRFYCTKYCAMTVLWAELELSGDASLPVFEGPNTLLWNRNIKAIAECLLFSVSKMKI
jgi:hypothetical protein